MEESISKRILDRVPDSEYVEKTVSGVDGEEFCEFRLELESPSKKFKHRLRFTGCESRLRLRADDSYNISEVEKDSAREDFILVLIANVLLK